MSKTCDNIALNKSMDFAVRIVKLYKYLVASKRESVMSKQLLRCGTSVGANVREAVYAQSKADFVSKMHISLKEASETEYWLELLRKTDYLTQNEYESIVADCVEMLKILTSIVKTAKVNN